MTQNEHDRAEELRRQEGQAIFDVIQKARDPDYKSPAELQTEKEREEVEAAEKAEEEAKYQAAYLQGKIDALKGN